LERYYGNEVVDDVSRELINETFPQAVDELKAFPLGLPLLEKDVLKGGASFKYTAVMETRPEFEMENYLGVEAEKEKISVTDADIQDRLEQIRNANGKLNAIEEDRSVEVEDYVVLNYEAFEGDQPAEGIRSENFLLKVGSHDFHPQFEKGLVGLKKGAETTIPVDFEEDYYHASLAGKHLDFRVNVLDIKAMELPELDDAFAHNLNSEFENLDDLREKVKETFTQEEESRVDRELKQRLIEKIAEGVDFELPQVLVDSEINNAIENIKQNLTRSGSNLTKAGLSEEKLREEFRASSEKKVKQMLILGEIARKEELSIDEEELTDEFKQLAARTGQDAEAIRNYYEARDLVDTLREKLLEEKTLNYLVQHAKINLTEKDKLTQNLSTEKETD
jgi:trigger factor